jgi:hypothetical protein
MNQNLFEFLLKTLKNLYLGIKAAIVGLRKKLKKML